MPLKVKGDGAWSLNTVKLAVGNDPEILEQEPNNSPKQAQAVSLPVTINGQSQEDSRTAARQTKTTFVFTPGRMRVSPLRLRRQDWVRHLIR